MRIWLMLVDMTKSLVKPRNIFLAVKDHNENNVTTIKQVYNVRYVYRRSDQGRRTDAKIDDVT